MDLTKALNLEKTERFEGSFNGEAYWFEAKAHKLTPKFHQAILDVAQQPVKLAAELADVITDWNIFLYKEGDFPPTAENISKIPEDFIFHLVDTIAASWSGKKQSAASLANGSAAAGH